MTIALFGKTGTAEAKGSLKATSNNAFLNHPALRVPLHRRGIVSSPPVEGQGWSTVFLEAPLSQSRNF